jgi:hypothetical protein
MVEGRKLEFLPQEIYCCRWWHSINACVDSTDGADISYYGSGAGLREADIY